MKINPNSEHFSRCICGKWVRKPTEICRACRRKHKIKDVDMFLAYAKKKWLSMPWVPETTEEEEEQDDECIRQANWGIALQISKAATDSFL